MKYLLLFIALPAWAALTPQAVRESALKFHPTVRGAVDRMLAGEETVRGARGAFDTKLVADHYRVASGFWARTMSDVMIEKPLQVANSKVYAGYSYGFNGMFPPQFSTVSTNSGGTPRVGASASVWRHRSIDPARAALRASGFDSQIARGEKDLTFWDIGRLSEIAYWEWVTAQRVETVYKNLLKNGEARNGFLESRAQRGDAPQILVRENEQYIANRKAGLMAATERRIRAEYALSLFLRNENGEPTLPAENEAFQDYPQDFAPLLASDELNANVEEIARRRPDIANLGADFEKSRIDLELAEQDLKPKVDVWGDYTRNIGDEDPTNPPHVWSFGVRLEIPIERNLGKGNIAAAKSRQSAAQRNWDLGRQTYQTEVLANKRALALQLGRVEQAAVELARARQLVEAESYKLKSGGGNLFLVNLREEAAANAEASWHESRFGFMSTLLSYQALVKVSDKPSGGRP